MNGGSSHCHKTPPQVAGAVRARDACGVAPSLPWFGLMTNTNSCSFTLRTFFLLLFKSSTAGQSGGLQIPGLEHPGPGDTARYSVPGLETGRYSVS